MIARLLAWWRRPPLRQRILNALSETEWLRAIDIARAVNVHSIRYGSVFVRLVNLEDDGLIEGKRGPVNSDGINHHWIYRKTRQ